MGNGPGVITVGPVLSLKPLEGAVLAVSQGSPQDKKKRQLPLRLACANEAGVCACAREVNLTSPLSPLILQGSGWWCPGTPEV